MPEQPPRQRDKLRRRLHESVRAAEHAGSAFQVDCFGRVGRRGIVEPEEAHPAGELGGVRLEEIDQLASAGNGNMLRLFVENGLNQVGGFDADLKQIGDQPANAGKRALRRLRARSRTSFTPGLSPSWRRTSSSSTEARSEIALRRCWRRTSCSRLIS